VLCQTIVQPMLSAFHSLLSQVHRAAFIRKCDVWIQCMRDVEIPAWVLQCESPISSARAASPVSLQTSASIAFGESICHQFSPLKRVRPKTAISPSASLTTHVVATSWSPRVGRTRAWLGDGDLTSQRQRFEDWLASVDTTRVSCFEVFAR
jgi:hypothetical protein